MMRHGFLVISLLALAGCSSSPDGDGGDATFNPPPPAISRPAPRPAEPVSAPPPAFKPFTDDQCGAQALQSLIGRPRTDIPVPLHPGDRRVVCSTCVITQDYRADRQTIIFDTDTGLITSVKCG